MKMALALGLMTLSISAFAQNNIDTQIENRAQALSNKILDLGEHIRLAPAQKAALLNYLKESNKLLNLANPGPSIPPTTPIPTPAPSYPTPVPGPGPSYPTPVPGPTYGRGNDVLVYADDSCQSLITPITNRDSCSLLNNVYQSRNVWSVRVNNKCFNTQDRTFSASCSMLQPLANEPVISNTVADLYHDDACQTPMIGLDPAVNYRAWSGVLSGMNVWSVRIENKCINIPDAAYSESLATNYINAALNMRGRLDPRDEQIQFYHDDACQNGMTQVQRGDNCSALSTFYGSQNVWSIRFRGRCENIQDMTFNNACQTYAR